MSTELTTRGFNASTKYINLVIDSLDEIPDISLRALAEAIIVEARSNLQDNGNVSVGDLFNSIKILEEGKNFIVVGSDSEYAFWIELGRGPIRPKDPDGVLHWIDRDTGEDVFAKFAKDTNPSPFLEPAVISNTKELENVFVEKIELIPVPPSGRDR